MPVVLIKYLNCVVNKTANTGHVANSNYNTDYSMMILTMIFFISSWSKPLKTDLCYSS